MRAWKNDGFAPVRAWVEGVPVETAALEQIDAVTRLPFVQRVAVMPDCHLGYGSTVGTVFASYRAVMPAAVGVDIGCGMVAAKTTLTASDLPDSLARVRSMIEQFVPHGRTNNGDPKSDKGSWRGRIYGNDLTWGPLQPGFSWLEEAYPKIAAWGDPRNHLGTLGTGNHFIEVCLDENDDVWVMLHSGSRGIGGRIGNHFMALAKRECESWFIPLPAKDLAYLPESSPLFGDYMRAVGWAQKFAAANRERMLSSTISALIVALDRPLGISEKAINCHHNYVARENHFGKNVLVTRKGAVRAREGDLGIIPGSMGARSYIVRGRGNAESLHSCSHGAGRAMSRGEAKRRFSIADHEAATAGIEGRKDRDVLDETPAAYKSIDAVMEAQSDLVEVVHTLRQAVCVKG